jgi:hypothetical protein
VCTDGSFRYTPNAGFAGTDTFTYRANDGIWSRDGVTPLSPDSMAGTVTITVKDITPPLVNLTIPPPTGSNGYFKTIPVLAAVAAADASNVSAIACADNGSNIAIGSLAGLGTPAAAGILSLSAEGAHNLTCTATDGASPANSGAAPGSNNTRLVKIDTMPPVTVFNSGPAEGAELSFGNGLAAGAAVTFGFSNTDPTSATNPATNSGVATVQCQFDSGAFSACTSPQTVSGLTIGPHTFSVRATDNAGNVGTATRSFKVVYSFILTPLKSPATLGSAVPIVWQLKDPQGALVSSLSTLVKMESVFNSSGVPSGGCVASSTGTTEVLYSPATGATGNSSFRYVPPFQFNWDTTTASTAPIITGKGCYTVLITLSDQSVVRMTNGVQLK